MLQDSASLERLLPYLSSSNNGINSSGGNNGSHSSGNGSGANDSSENGSGDGAGASDSAPVCLTSCSIHVQAITLNK